MIIYRISRLDEKRKATINLENKDNKFFQYAAMVALNYGEIKWNSRILNIIPLINMGWTKILIKNRWFENVWKSYPKIALNNLHTKEMEIYPNYTSKSNPNCEKQITHLIIPNEKNWHYLALKKTVCITKKNNLKNNGDFYCLSWLHYFRIGNKL